MKEYWAKEGYEFVSKNPVQIYNEETREYEDFYIRGVYLLLGDTDSIDNYNEVPLN